MIPRELFILKNKIASKYRFYKKVKVSVGHKRETHDIVVLFYLKNKSKSKTLKAVYQYTDNTKLRFINRETSFYQLSRLYGRRKLFVPIELISNTTIGSFIMQYKGVIY